MTQLLSLAMTTHNNADTIAKTLESALPHCDRLMLLDLGSDDDTVDIAIDVATRHRIGPDIHRLGAVEAMRDGKDSSSVQRNFILACGEEETQFVLLMQPGETLEPVGTSTPLDPRRVERGGLRDWCRLQKVEPTSAGLVATYREDGVLGAEPRIVRSGSGWRFRGRAFELLHPQPIPWPPVTANLPREVVIRTLTSPMASDYRRFEERLRRDLDEAGRDIGAGRESKISYSRTLLYMARVCDAAGAVEVAEGLHERRLASRSGSPEDYLALMWAAEHFAAKGDTARASHLYTAAHLRFEDRAEPFEKLAQLDIDQGAFEHALINAQRGLLVEMPDPGTCFELRPETYLHTLAGTAGLAAGHLGQWGKAEAAFARALHGVRVTDPHYTVYEAARDASRAKLAETNEALQELGEALQEKIAVQEKRE